QRLMPIAALFAVVDVMPGHLFQDPVVQRVAVRLERNQVVRRQVVQAIGQPAGEPPRPRRKTTTSRSCFFRARSFSSSTTNGVPAKKSVRIRPKSLCQSSQNAPVTQRKSRW